MLPANFPRAEIHLEAISHNFNVARQRSFGQKMMAVIKANAYGHGLLPVARKLAATDAFAVARVGEGVQLRESGIAHTVVILEGFINADELALCYQHDLTPVIHSAYQLDLLDEPIAAWIKINTGMFRLGFHWQQIAEIKNKLGRITLLGLVSHFANADDPDHAENRKQFERLLEASEQLGSELPLCLDNSGAILNMDLTARAGVDWVRPGIMLYGGSPDGSVDKRLKPAMTLTAPVIAINHLQPGDAVGYGGHFVANVPCRVAVVALGYADGYPREMPEGTPVIVAGKRRKLVGRVSMDMCCVLLEGDDALGPGDRVEFWGRQLPVDEVAAHLGTISYSLLAGLGPRVVRHFEPHIEPAPAID